MCGGTLTHPSSLGFVHGLSPRVRGNRRRHPRFRFTDGSIPACAGEPQKRGWSPRLRRVYPRVCGGTVMSQPVLCPVPGLSPRVRGNQGKTVGTAVCSGSIPACAGEPRLSSRRAQRQSVYPRVCGGTMQESHTTWPCLGLSPRVRGNRILKRELLDRWGSIPACAGNQGCQPAADVGAGSIPACAGEPRGKLSGRIGTTVYPRVCGGTGRAETT